MGLWHSLVAFSGTLWPQKGFSLMVVGGGSGVVL